MNIHEAAAMLDGREYREELTIGEAHKLREAGLVAVFGASDDLMEFRGAIDDEIGAYDGNVAFVDRYGLLPDRAQIKDDDELRNLFSREPGAVPVHALWCGEEDYSWTFATDIPHTTFEITEDGEPYCRGIVFALASVGRAEHEHAVGAAETPDPGSPHPKGTDQ